MTTELLEPQVPAGLDGVEVARTAVGDVRGRDGFFHYREHDATELARRRSFDDVWALLIDGMLPNAANAERFAARLDQWRALPATVRHALPAVARASGDDRLGALRTAMSLTGSALGLEPWDRSTPAGRRDDAVRLAAATPVLLAALHGAGSRWPAGTGTAAGYLAAVTGASPSHAHVRALDRYLVATIDHGLNASTFTARTITSTGADLAGALVGALAALSGPLHGGAPGRVLELLHAIGRPDRAADHVRAAVRGGERVPGFGHRIYRTEDPRAALLRDTALEIDAPLAELAVAVERAVTRVLAEEKPGRELHVNVEFHAAVVLDAVGLPPALFTPTFAIARTVGWTAHALEQMDGNRIVRPSSRYVGPPAPVPVPRR